MGAATVIIRPTARLIALDPHGRVLLFHCRNGYRDALFWIAPGGGVEEGETFEQAALREMREETGIDARSPIGPCVLESDTIGRHPDYGDQDLICRGRTFPVHLRAAEVTMLDPDAVERSGYIGHRWWSLDELDVATEPVYPEGLADIIRRISGAYG
jgi:8-oxo-dGTP diphosphatase